MYGNKFVPMIGYINTQKNFRAIGTLEGPARKPNPLGSNKITYASFNIAYHL